MRWNLANQSGWLDGSTLRLCFTLHNLRPDAALSPDADSPACVFRRIRVVANSSSVIEDIEDYGRTFQIFSELLPSQKRFSNCTEAWGSVVKADTLDNPFGPSPVPADSARQVCVQLLSPFFSQGKWIPLSTMPITVEMDDADSAFVGTGAVWEITRPRLVASVCELDQALQNSYAKHLLDGKSLPLYTHGIYSVKAAVPIGSSI